MGKTCHKFNSIENDYGDGIVVARKCKWGVLYLGRRERDNKIFRLRYLCPCGCGPSRTLYVEEASNWYEHCGTIHRIDPAGAGYTVRPSIFHSCGAHFLIENLKINHLPAMYINDTEGVTHERS